jgi:transposase-like protein
MEYILFLMLGLIAFFVILWQIVLWAFSKMKCPFCGEYMDSYYREETKKFEYHCPKCDYHIEM